MCELAKEGHGPDHSDACFDDSMTAEYRILLEEIRRKDAEIKKASELLHEEREKRNRIEQELLSEKKIADDIIESLPELLYVVDDDNRMIKWNKNVEEVTGYSADELLYMSALNFFIPEDRPVLRDWVAEVWKHGKSTLYRDYQYKDGTIRPYFFTGLKTTINGKGYQIGVGIDCSEIENARDALRATEEKLALAADSAEAGLWSMDLGTGTWWLTPKCMELHGLSQECKERPDILFDTIVPPDRKAFSAAIEETIKTGQDFKIEYRVLLPNHQCRWIIAKGRLISSLSGKPQQITGVSIDITERKEIENQLKEKVKEIVGLKKQLEKDNVYLREEVSQFYDYEGIIGESQAFKDVLNRASQVAPTNSTVLILGETGTGKEVLARMIHNLSQRRDRPLITVNCASLPPSLIEGELFGREKGAYNRRPDKNERPF